MLEVDIAHGENMYIYIYRTLHSIVNSIIQTKNL